MNITNILNLQKLQKEVKTPFCIKSIAGNDKFVSSKSKFIEDAIEQYSFSSLEDIVEDLAKIRSWSDGINYIGYHKTLEDKILGVVLGKYDNTAKEVQSLELKPNEVKSFITALFAKFINKEPSKENEFKNLYLNFLKVLDNHS